MKGRTFWRVVVVAALVLFAAWIYGHRWTYTLAPGAGLTRINRFTGSIYYLQDGSWVTWDRL